MTNLNGINIQSTVIRKDNQSGCLAGMKAFCRVYTASMILRVVVTELTSMTRSSNFCIQFLRAQVGVKKHKKVVSSACGPNLLDSLIS